MEPEREPLTEVLGFVPRLGNVHAQSLCLVVTSGPGKGSLFPLAAGEWTLGRSAQSADIVLSGRGLSRSHAKLFVSSLDEVTIEDLHSTNGVFVNGLRVSSIALQPGDVLSLGPDVTLRLDAADQTLQSLLQEMHISATTDSLTGVLNRRSFMDRLTQEWSSTQRHQLTTCVAIVDVDHFKSVNDTHGHPVGDQVLKEVARRIKTTVRVEDIVARYGGEEFVVLLPQTAAEGGVRLLERVRVAVAEEPFLINSSMSSEASLPITLSGGVAQITATESAEQALERADKALYQAKHGGRNRIQLADAPPSVVPEVN